MVELVDTLVSGTRALTGVQVQVLFRAYIQAAFFSGLFLLPLIKKNLLICKLLNHIEKDNSLPSILGKRKPLAVKKNSLE